MGPHPAVAAVRLAVRQALARHTRPDEPLLVACSGGADSLALAAAAAFETQHTERRAGLITVDHGLQAGSSERAAQVAELGYQLGFDPVIAVAVAVGETGGPEGAARAARYQAFTEAARSTSANDKEAVILLGHTADDQAETVLLGLGRGSGLDSLAGMRPRTGQFVRPLLGLRRTDTRAACDALGLPVWDDPHNDDPRYRRVRVRREVLPLLDDVLGGGVVAALGRTAEQLQEASDALRGWEAALADKAARPDGGLDVVPLTTCPPAITARVVKAWAERAGVPALSAVHVRALAALIADWHGQGPIDLPGGFGVIRRSGSLNVVPPVTELLDHTTATDE